MNTMLNPYWNILKNWNKIKGRTTRHTYWSALLTMFIILAVLLWFAEKIFVLRWLPMVFCIAMIPPFFTATVRRLHDVRKSGWFLLCNLLPVIGFIGIFVYLVQDGSESENRYILLPVI